MSISQRLLQIIFNCVKVKVVFIKRSIQSVGPLKALYTFFLPWQTCSFQHQLGFSGKLSSHAAITRNDYITHISTTVYSQVLIRTAESTGRQWGERKCPIFETVAKGDSNPGSIDCESDILPLSFRAPHKLVAETYRHSYVN